MIIRLTANAGLLIKFADATFLVDGLHNDKAAPFSAVPEKTLKEAIERRGAFSHIDALLFTHAHKDHYDEECARAFLESHNETDLIFPALGENSKVFIKYRIKNVTVEAKKLPHEGKQYKDVSNYGFFIYNEFESIFISGDAAISAEPIISFLDGRKPTAAAVCFPFVTLERGRKIIEQIAPEIIIAYHLPFVYEDDNNYCLSCRRVAETGKLHSPIEYLCEPDKEIII